MNEKDVLEAIEERIKMLESDTVPNSPTIDEIRKQIELSIKSRLPLVKDINFIK